MTREALLVATVLLCASGARAHTLAGTTVTLTVAQPRTVTVMIAAEADPLIAKLETLADADQSHPPVASDDRRVRLVSLFPTLRENIDARIDEMPLALELDSLAVDDTAQVEIRLTAAIPHGPGMFTWRSTFVFGAYRLAVASDHAADEVEWLHGPQRSTPIALASSQAGAKYSAQGLTRIGHSLAMGTLVLYVLRRRSRSTRLIGAGLNVNGWPADSSPDSTPR
jgi:hypothetical protein